MPIFTYCGYISLGWSESRKRMIRSIEARSLAIISPKCSPQNCDLRILTIDTYLQKRAYCFVFLYEEKRAYCFVIFIYLYICLYFSFVFYFNFRGLFCKSLISEIDILNKDYYYYYYYLTASMELHVSHLKVTSNGHTITP